MHNLNYACFQIFLTLLMQSLFTSLETNKSLITIALYLCYFRFFKYTKNSFLIVFFKFLDKKSILIPTQYGFRPHHSTQHAILDITV